MRRPNRLKRKTAKRYKSINQTISVEEPKIILVPHTKYVCIKEFSLPLFEENSSTIVKVGNLYELNTDFHDNKTGGDIHLDLVHPNIVGWIEVDEEILNEYFTEIIHFELNNWTPGKDYPAEEPFITWIGNDLNIHFNSDNWVQENKLCVVRSIIDMSVNFCITTTKEWVEKNCPKLLTEYQDFLRHPDEDGFVEGRFGNYFLDYTENNIGITDDNDDEFDNYSAED